ncbi:ABC transporter substrate-binding protein [Psychroserpens sp.]|uniref:ABC transporter substrate-binding protein n=1 Tax=Psychroserpens sp. TaxID=2020870 RepID=UPI001B10D266|nr:ABC transporter substrate-binding protein [Psychroserpens sp.]MBO6607066.1 ABC transporter substrate-binding protein [Psychroserpens sp.]MBO6654212.1 ABC transporter substrate-binding protein [Psychroserpens sp.]MBO6682502.1 ABC transporter substrate-binding protein [Psychroserpens sp.]MBO6750838.1 ABC transporter substrate-binding protein [Psychroserpens sp.]MBO6915733.1 ABC transporter substrate-binding protein [Psychroserpens sp.]
MLHNKSVVLSIFLLLMVFCCKDAKDIDKLEVAVEKQMEISHAEGFSITDYGDYSVLNIDNPWPKADKSYRYALIPKENAARITLNKEEFDGIIETPIERIVVTSTTHIPALELLESEQSLVGFPGMDYISSEKTRTRIDNQQIRELGKNEGINIEVLIEIQPQAVVAFGVDGANKSMETVSKANIPVLYNGDWVEKSPLAKAEWIKFFGALYNKSKEAATIFETIEREYKEAKAIAAEAKQRPTVLCGAMYKDVWYLPNGTSPEAQFLKDANANYIWSETTETGSIALSFESVFDKANDADLWLSPSYYSSYSDLAEANVRYTKFDAFESNKIYTFANTTGATGGVIYYELGTTRPDLVLKDMINICHPDLLTDYEPTFFKPLAN